MLTKVIFRFWKGDVIAIFPEAFGSQARYCLSYQHIGQHGDCEPHHIIRESRLATRAEYLPLARELRKIGYRLKITKRMARGACDAREQEFKAFIRNLEWG